MQPTDYSSHNPHQTAGTARASPTRLSRGGSGVSQQVGEPCTRPTWSFWSFRPSASCFLNAPNTDSVGSSSLPPLPSVEANLGLGSLPRAGSTGIPECWLHRPAPGLARCTAAAVCRIAYWYRMLADTLAGTGLPQSGVSPSPHPTLHFFISGTIDFTV